MGRCRGRWARHTLVMLAVTAASTSTAQGDDVPRGKFGLSFGVRQGLGQLSDDYGLGTIGAIEAGYHPGDPDRSLSFGLSWSVVWGSFGADEASIAGTLDVLEFNFGARLRRLMEPSARFLIVGSGLTLLRTNVPIPPDDERVYVGPYVSAGVEQLVWDTLLLSFEARYGLLVGGPGSISICLGIGFGS